MAMEWNNRGYQLDPNGGNNKVSFQVHDERMKEFRSSHANVAMVNGVRLDEAALLQGMEPLRVHRTTIETGGTDLLNGTADPSALDRLVLVPMWKVARYKLSQN